MLNGVVIFFQSYGFFGGGRFGDLLSRLAELGFFDLILPFLIIFAMVFGILTKVKIFEDNKGVNGIIALSVGLMAIQFSFVSEFFSEVFPRIAVGLIVILVVLIFLGLFTDPDSSGQTWVFWGVGVVVALTILIQSFEETTFWNNTFFFGTTISDLLILAFILGLVALIIGTSSKDSKSYRKKGMSPFERALRGD